jgi:hypothetical protein
MTPPASWLQTNQSVRKKMRELIAIFSTVHLSKNSFVRGILVVRGCGK